MKVKITEIKVNHGVMIRRELDENRIQEFTEIFDQLPPIKVFNVDGILLLADGFHRLAAAERLGLSEIEAEVRKGSRNDAILEAISINAKHGKPLNSQEKAEAVKRLRAMRPQMAHKEIGAIVGVSSDHVGEILRAEEVRASLGRPTFLSDSHLAEVSRLDKGLWKDFVSATEERGWVVDETALASQEIRDEKIPAERKRALLAGATDPMTQKEGKPAYLGETVQRRVVEGLAQDKVVALTRAWDALSKLEQFEPKDVVDSLEDFHLDRVAKDTPRDIDYLGQLLKFARERLGLWQEIDSIRKEVDR